MQTGATSGSGASRGGARVAIGAASVALVALAVLHVTRPDLDPPAHLISEYARGAHGWVMTVCFAAFATSCIGLCLSLAMQATTRLARVGLALLGLAAFGLALGGLFPTDPPATAPDAMSFSGQMHGVGFLVGVPSELLCVLLLSVALRREARRSSALLLVLTAAMWLSVAVMVPLIVGQTAWFGIPNRTFMVSFGVWLMVAATPMARGRTVPPSPTA